MTWIAVFEDGPAVGDQRHFMAGSPYDDLWLMPHPERGWEASICVGYGHRPEMDWPGQMHYRRVDSSRNEDDELTVTFGLAELDRYRHMFPEIKWGEPVEVTVPDVAHGYACRVCIAKNGLKGRQVKGLPRDRDTVVRHILQAHA
jgi:hypothetical protein